MAQTELMLRLLKDGKIVGYIEAKKYGPHNLLGWFSKAWDIHDSFELGIKVADEWWFEGDIIKCKLCTGELIYDALNGFRYVSHQHGDAVSFAGWDIINQFERIGNIHEQENK